MVFRDVEIVPGAEMQPVLDRLGEPRKYFESESCAFKGLDKVYTYAGTGIVAYMQRGTTWTPMPGDAYLVHNLLCTVDTNVKSYFIKFDCHGGHFEESGRLK